MLSVHRQLFRTFSILGASYIFKFLIQLGGLSWIIYFILDSFFPYFMIFVMINVPFLNLALLKSWSYIFPHFYIVLAMTHLTLCVLWSWFITLKNKYFIKFMNWLSMGLIGLYILLYILTVNNVVV